MRYIIFLFAVVFLAPVFSPFNSNGVQAFNKSGCEMDCQKCHALTSQEIKEVLKDLKAPDAVRSLAKGSDRKTNKAAEPDKGRVENEAGLIPLAFQFSA